MKINCSPDARGGMTLVEVMVLIAVLFILAALVLPMRSTRVPSLRINCMSNQKQIGIGFLMYTEDNHGKFPMGISVSNGGTMEYLDRNQTFPHYQKLSANSELIRSLVCPADKNRQAATNFQSLTDANISYFLNANVSTNNPADSILSGDRHLQVSGQPVNHGTLIISSNSNVEWTAELHDGNGLLGFADGRAQFSRSGTLSSLIRAQNPANQRFSVP